MTETLRGKGAVPGVAVGAVRLASRDISGAMAAYTAAEPAAERKKYLAALAEAGHRLTADIDAARSRGDDIRAEILQAHLLIMNDPAMTASVDGKIGAGMPAPQAALAAAEEHAAVLRALDDGYLRERAADILDVQRRVAKTLLGVEDFDPKGEPAILCADELDPSILAGPAADAVQGLILGSGSTASHAVILAKARGLATVVGVTELDKIADGTPVIIDGDSGEIILRPDRAVLGLYAGRRRRQRREIGRAHV